MNKVIYGLGVEIGDKGVKPGKLDLCTEYKKKY